MDIINEFRNVLNDPYAYAGEWKKKNGKKVVGFFCSYAPEELVLAADCLPVRLFGTRDNIVHADAHLQSYSCSLIRGALEEALTGRLDFLDGAVFPHTCDSIQRLSDIWRMNMKFSFHWDVVMPVKLNTESAREYMRDVLHDFRDELSSGLGVEISDEKIQEAIALYNRIRSLLKKIYEIRSKFPSVISGSDMHAILRGSMIMDRHELPGKLEKIVEHLEAESANAEDSSAMRLMFTGGICDFPDIFTVIEESGGVVAWDDLCTGSRYFEGSISNAGDPVSAIAERYTSRVICPAKHASVTSRGENITELAKEHDIAGVIFLYLKFCDPHSWDYPYMKEYLDRAGVPSMLLEVEDRLPSEGQLRTRFETFIQTL